MISQQNKQNTVPNKSQLQSQPQSKQESKNIFSNPLICAKMFKSSPSSSPSLSPQIFQPQQSQSQSLTQSKISLQLDNIELKSDKKYYYQYQKQQQQQQKQQQQPTPLCTKHNKILSNLFCVQCLNYNICRTCISASHSQHQIMQFQSKQQMLSQTKQLLLQTLQQTLKDLKSKQNQIKNRTHQISLIKSSLKSLQQDIIGIISSLFRQIQTKLIISLQKNNKLFNQDIQLFFSEYNKINDQLRQNLMCILDSNINICQFNKNMVIKQAPIIPNFINYKNTLEKYKKIFKDVKNQLNVVKNILQKGCQSVIIAEDKSYKNTKNTVLSKFDKYIQNNSNNQRGDKVNQSFMKTLKLLEIGSDKENLLKFNNSGIGMQKAKISRKIF